MNILLEVLRWSFIAGFSAVFCVVAFLGGLTSSCLLFIVCADYICRLREKVISKSKDGKP